MIRHVLPAPHSRSCWLDGNSQVDCVWMTLAREEETRCARAAVAPSAHEAQVCYGQMALIQRISSIHHLFEMGQAEILQQCRNDYRSGHHPSVKSAHTGYRVSPQKDLLCLA